MVLSAGAASRRVFRAADDGSYRLTMVDPRIECIVERLRREHGELFGELAVYCDLPGARAIDGCISVGTFNLSSPRARQDRARLLAEQSRTNKIDFASILEELAQRVLVAERQGQPAILLETLQRPTPDDVLDVNGMRLTARPRPQKWPRSISGPFDRLASAH